jgi:LmbE family N-acetylglucosaminyl deacetylase
MVVAAGQSAWRAMRLTARRLSPPALAARGGWLVLAPHPDDETLGAASIIAALAEQKRPAWVALLTDGSASHAGAPDWPPERIAQARAGEARTALRKLGARPNRLTLLGWRDAEPHPLQSPEFARSRDRLIGLCRRAKIRSIAVSWRHEAHCDHQAAYELARAVQRRSHARISLYEYLVWGWTDPELLRRTRDRAKLAVDSPKSARLGRRAIQAHRTQLSPMIGGAARGFRLPPAITALAGRNPAVILEEGYRHAP